MTTQNESDDNTTNGKIPPRGVALLAYQRRLAESQIDRREILLAGSLDHLGIGEMDEDEVSSIS